MSSTCDNVFFCFLSSSSLGSARKASPSGAVRTHVRAARSLSLRLASPARVQCSCRDALFALSRRTSALAVQAVQRMLNLQLVCCNTMNLYSEDVAHIYSRQERRPAGQPHRSASWRRWRVPRKLVSVHAATVRRARGRPSFIA